MDEEHIPANGTVETGLLAQSPGTDVNPILRPPLVGLEFSVNGNRVPTVNNKIIKSNNNSKTRN